jgi:hypothetical protein
MYFSARSHLLANRKWQARVPVVSLLSHVVRYVRIVTSETSAQHLPKPTTVLQSANVQRIEGSVGI